MVEAVWCCHVDRSETSPLVTAALSEEMVRDSASLRMTMTFPF